MTGRRTKKTPEIVAKAVELRAEGLDYEAIGKVVGASGTTVHMWLDPTFAAHRRRLINDHRLGKYSGLEIRRVDIRPSAEEVERGLRAIPKDTRDLTAKICGDPVPGRRAIDRQRTDNNKVGENLFLLGMQ